MKKFVPRLLMTLGSAATFLLAGASATPEGENWARLESMPRARRLFLLDQLGEFDSLPRPEREAVRALDAKVAAEPEEARADEYAVLRRYHLWIRQLTEAHRAELAALPPEARLKRAAAMFRGQKASSPRRPPYFLIAEFGSVSPFVLADQIRVWLALNDKQKDSVRNAPEADRNRRLNLLAAEVKFVPVPVLTKQQSEKLFARATRNRLYPFLKKFDDAKKEERFKARLVDHYYFVENAPAKVRADRLVAFDDALPYWVRSGFDSLPPEEARRRLTILYRLVFGNGEMPDATELQAKKAASPASASPPAPPAPAKTPANRAPTAPTSPF